MATATTAQDFTTTTVKVNFADEDTAEKNVSIPIVDDQVSKANETFSVSLSASGGQMHYEVGRYASQAGPTVMATSEQTVNMLAAHLRYALLLEAA